MSPFTRNWLGISSYFFVESQNAIGPSVIYYLIRKLPMTQLCKQFRYSRERRVFEKYQKAARTMPDKKERDEIEGLRAQVSK